MATKLSSGATRNIIKRSYAQAAAQSSSSYFLPQHEPEVSTLPSGAVVASIENNSPVSKIAILFKAGSRYETGDNLGVSHVLRKAGGLATSNMSAFGIMRNAQQNGATISVDGGREHVSYSCEIIRDYAEVGLSIIAEMGCNPLFKSWEIEDLSFPLYMDLALVQNSTHAVECAHRAAFRTGLGNPILLSQHRLGSVSSEELKGFHESTHTTGGMAVVGLGIDHATLVKFAKSVSLPKDAATSSSVYKGGEIRLENGSSLAHVVVSGIGAGLKDQDALSLGVAHYALGIGSTIKYGGNASSPLTAAVNSAGGAGAASSLNVNYSDAGLFGYSVVADADQAGSILKAVHNAVKEINLTDGDVANAKYKLKAALAQSADSKEQLFEDLGLQALCVGSYTKPSDVAAKIDTLSTSDVNAAIKRAFSGKLTMGAAGGLKTVPYVDEL